HAAPLAPAPAIHHPTRTDEHARSLIAEKKKFPVVPVAATVIVLLGIAAGAVVIMKGKKPAATTASAATKTSAAPANVQTAPPTDGAAIVTDTATTSTPMAAVETAGTIPIDQALVDQEVRKRLEAERTRLEQQRQEQLAAAERAREARSQPEESPTAAASAPAPAPQTQTAAPPPQTATVAEARPEPPPAQTATPVAERPVREGDLVETGTPGLIAPELLNFRKPAYPPIAKMRRVEGVVVLSVLVSETGRPMDVKVLRGVKENVGINEAAVEALRNATFRLATKDGVRVKTYKTVTIPFEL
ncbi:MAG TPA: TonB family protein, partial [Thermoanaerobaculia bacterium]